MKGKSINALALSLAACVAGAAEYELTDSTQVIGEARVILARYEDTFVSLAQTYNLGFEELRRANPGVDAWLPGEGTEIVLPTQHVLPRAPRTGIVVNLPELRLYYFPAGDGSRVLTYPISVGRMDWSTPLGVTSVTGKVANPSWYPPKSIREEHLAQNRPLPAVVPPGPDNPLGKHALRLGLPSYLIHGTNKPSGVGMQVTHGCIRMFPEDIEALYRMVPIGTPVRIVDQPYKLGWTDAGWYLEAHAPLRKAQPAPEGTSLTDADAWLEETPVVTDLTELTRAFVAATEEVSVLQGRQADVDWESAERVAREARGIPELVSRGLLGDDNDLLDLQSSNSE